MAKTIEFSFSGRTAVITGGASGLGLEIARTLSECGGRVVIMDHNDELGRAAVARLNETAAEKSHFVSIDVRDADAVASAFASVDALGGNIDLLVNSAGVREIDSAFDLPTPEWDRVIGINLNGTFYCAQQAARRMRVAGRGNIINIASVAGLISIKKRPAYVASKHAVVGLTKELAAEFGAHGIRVNAIAPGTLRTPMTEKYWADPNFAVGMSEVVPLNADGDAADVASAVAFLASEHADFITGIVLPVDGGWVIEKTFSPRASAYTRSAGE
uniref:Glucose 1-dehydrogenase n=1 Tax=Bosea sp. NBC_00436 TaxID=2969620 RepID=A0A9E7ZZG2_9HYPH